MKANELRIGNLVTLIDRSGKVHMPNGVVYKIYSINIFTCVICDARLNFTECQQSDLFDVNISDLSPIQLTEDWLVRFGFKKHKVGISGADMWQGMDGWSLGDNEWIFRGNPKHGLKLVGYWNSDIKYVHELQNLYFALTGDELKLKA